MKTSGTCQPQRERLNQFVDLARVYRGWTRGELSKALGRDPSKIVPESGNPKLDLLVGLADALDWQVGDVAESVWNEQPDNTCNQDLTFEELRPLALAAFHEGRHTDLNQIATRMLGLAQTAEERARASYIASLAWDGVGRYSRALACLQEALTERNLSTELLIFLQNNLANAHYSLWHLLEAKAISQDVIARLEKMPIEGDLKMQDALAFSHYVAGNTARRMIETNCPDLPMRAAEARQHLRRAIELYSDALAVEDNPNWAGVVNTCRGALIEVDAADGNLDPLAAVEQISNGLDAVIDPEQMPAGDLLETWGWWSIFGCNIALRGVAEPDLHHYMAIFTNKAIEIADHLGNWAMRERAFTMENFRRRRVAEATGFKPDWTLDDEDVRVIAGTMGRFPGFRETGWHILETARVFDGR